MTTPPLACTLTPDQLRCDAAVLLPGLQSRAVRVVWETEGVRLTLDATSENLAVVFHAIQRERRCCA